MNIKDMKQPSKYLSCDDLKDPEDNSSYLEYTLTISGCHDVEVKDFKTNQPVTKYVLDFQGADKGMILNKTNITTLGHLFGPETDDWIGKPVIVFAIPCNDANGNPTMGLRVRGVPKQGNRPAFASKPALGDSTHPPVQPARQVVDGSEPLPGDDGAVTAPRGNAIPF
jgi:hypothetical protein